MEKRYRKKLEKLAPEIINKDPYGEGWLIKIKIADTGEVDELLDAVAYKKLLEA